MRISWRFCESGVGCGMSMLVLFCFCFGWVIICLWLMRWWGWWVWSRILLWGFCRCVICWKFWGLMRRSFGFLILVVGSCFMSFVFCLLCSGRCLWSLLLSVRWVLRKFVSLCVLLRILIDVGILRVIRILCLFWVIVWFLFFIDRVLSFRIKMKLCCCLRRCC